MKARVPLRSASVLKQMAAGEDTFTKPELRPCGYDTPRLSKDFDVGQEWPTYMKSTGGLRSSA